MTIVTKATLQLMIRTVHRKHSCLSVADHHSFLTIELLLRI